MKTIVFESLLDATKAIKNGEFQQIGTNYLEDFYSRSCIYLLIQEQIEGQPEIVYVGQTKSLGKRLGAHYDDANKEFDSFGYIFVKDELLDEMEAILISVFQPKYNGNGNNWYIKQMAKHMRIKSIHHLKKGYGVSAEKVNINTVIGILECNGNIGKWMAQNLEF
ncbi:hypothetical protein ACVBE9_09660 [Eionea flava]